MNPCPNCDEASVTDEEGCCIHCGVPRLPQPEVQRVIAQWDAEDEHWLVMFPNGDVEHFASPEAIHAEIERRFKRSGSEGWMITSLEFGPGRPLYVNEEES
jgi:hypothetical protein